MIVHSGIFLFSILDLIYKNTSRGSRGKTILLNIRKAERPSNLVIIKV